MSQFRRLVLQTLRCARHSGAAASYINREGVNAIPHIHSFGPAARFYHVSRVSLSASQDASDKSVEVETFSELGKADLLDPLLVEAITKAGFTKMTPVQQKAIGPIVSTKEGLVARAKTGTGKTLAFGLPVIQSVLNAKREGASGVKAVVVAPTRDLALQIKDELAKVLSKQRDLGITVGCATGGESKDRQIDRMFRRRIPDIMVFTPGRLLDILDSGFADSFGDLQFFVLDESDRLLDIGFKDTIVEIEEKLQEASNKFDGGARVLLFSATIDRSVKSFASKLIGKKFKYIDCIDPNEPESHHSIRQVAVVSSEGLLDSFKQGAAFVANSALKLEDSRHRSNKADAKNFKAIVFLPTVKAVDWMYHLMNQYFRFKRSRIQRSKLHGKMTVAQRQRVVNSFKTADNGILFTTDVGARGMDFPNTTTVIQLGQPSTAATYIHRIGRTARAGKSGESYLFLSKMERPFLRELDDIGIVLSETVESMDLPEIDDIETYFMESEDPEVGKSLIGSYLSLMRSLDANSITLCKNIKEFNEGVGYTEKMHVNPLLWRNQMNMDARTAAEFFTVEGRPNSYHTIDAPGRAYKSYGSRSNQGGNYRSNQGGNYNRRKNNYSDRVDRAFDAFDRNQLNYNRSERNSSGSRNYKRGNNRNSGNSNFDDY